MTRKSSYPPLAHRTHVPPTHRDMDCDLCGQEICDCVRWPFLGLMVRVLIVLLGLYVLGCAAGVLQHPWCD